MLSKVQDNKVEPVGICPICDEPHFGKEPDNSGNNLVFSNFGVVWIEKIQYNHITAVGGAESKYACIESVKLVDGQQLCMYRQRHRRQKQDLIEQLIAELRYFNDRVDGEGYTIKKESK